MICWSQELRCYFCFYMFLFFWGGFLFWFWSLPQSQSFTEKLPRHLGPKKTWVVIHVKRSIPRFLQGKEPIGSCQLTNSFFWVEFITMTKSEQKPEYILEWTVRKYKYRSWSFSAFFQVSIKGLQYDCRLLCPCVGRALSALGPSYWCTRMPLWNYVWVDQR